MPFEKGNTLGKGRPKGSQNINADIKEQLSDLLQNALNRIDIESMDNNQLLKFLQLAMGYQLPKLKHETSERDEIFEQPLFVDVITRDENTGEDKRLETYHRKVNGECSLLEK